MDNRRTFRLTDEEYEQLRIQAEKLGTDRTGYIKLIIALDAATGIIGSLKWSTESKGLIQEIINKRKSE